MGKGKLNWHKECLARARIGNIKSILWQRDGMRALFPIHGWQVDMQSVPALEKLVWACGYRFNSSNGAGDNSVT